MNGKLRNMTSLYILDKNDKMLLLYRVGSRVIKNSYIGTAGGHFEEDELNDAKKCVLRELQEETNLVEDDLENIELRYVTLRLKNGEIRQNYYFFAKLINEAIEIESNEGELKWFNQEEVSSLKMPHTAKFVAKHYIEEGKNTNDIYGGIAVQEGLCFTKIEQFDD